MAISRRELLTGAAVSAACVSPTCAEARNEMYGLIGKITSAAGQRDALIGFLLESVNEMPGCISYVVAKDSADENAVWVTEIWDSKESHDSSLSIPAVRAAIAKAKPIIAGFGPSMKTTPVGGFGLGAPKLR